MHIMLTEMIIAKQKKRKKKSTDQNNSEFIKQANPPKCVTITLTVNHHRLAKLLAEMSQPLRSSRNP